jgi:ASC-1-like (ASCH) protein
MFLTSISILLPLVIGFIALVVSVERKNYSYEKIGKIILLILLSLLLSTVWYTPKFWWVTIANPSLGGVPLGKLAWSILQFILQFLPLVLAIFVIRLKKYKFEGHFLFGLLFFSSFLFLSLVRFISDPDFVADWISFGLELQMGGAILLASALAKVKSQKSKLKSTTQKSKLFIFIGFILLSACVSLFIVRNMSLDLGSDYQSSITSMLKKNVKDNERVFLSGSSVFFINSRLNIQQVRGGVDQGSINPFWAHGAYQIREGINGSLTYDWLRVLGVSYVLAHNKDSVEPFKDFKYPLKFTQLCHSDPDASGEESNDKKCMSPAYFQLVKEDRGDMLYRVNNASIGRIADSSILNVQKPKSGADSRSINNYISSFKRSLAVNSPMENQKPNEIAFEENIKQGEVISLAVTYDSLWQIVYGKGKIVSDSLGNMVIIPKNTGSQKFVLVYKRSFLDLAIPLGLSIVIVIILIKYQKIIPYVRKRFPKLHVGLEDEED